MYVGVAVLVGQDREVVAGGFAFAADQLLLPFPRPAWDQCPIEDAMARWYEVFHGWCGWEKAFQKVKDCVDGAGNRGLGHPIDRGDHTLREVFAPVVD